MFFRRTLILVSLDQSASILLLPAWSPATLLPPPTVLVFAAPDPCSCPCPDPHSWYPTGVLRPVSFSDVQPPAYQESAPPLLRPLVRSQDKIEESLQERINHQLTMPSAASILSDLGQWVAFPRTGQQRLTGPQPNLTPQLLASRPVRESDTVPGRTNSWREVLHTASVLPLLM